MARRKTPNNRRAPPTQHRATACSRGTALLGAGRGCSNRAANFGNSHAVHRFPLCESVTSRSQISLKTGPRLHWVSAANWIICINF